MQSSIVVSGLRVVRDGTEALRGVSLEVAPGRVTGLLGPSGSGKTTLMRSIVGVQVVDEGEVRVLGLPAGDPALRHVVGYMTQAPSVYSDLTVRENLRFFARVLRATGSVDAVVEVVSLAGQVDQVAHTLSGGERARVSLAVALLGEPKVLVLDEPTVGLDPVLRRDLWEMFHRLAAAGVTVLVSSHVMDEADRCDELVLLRDGIVLARETPAGLRRRTGATDLDAAFLTLIDSPGPR